MQHENHIIELFTGYSLFDQAKQEMKANCTVTLIKGEKKIILVDTLTAWDRDNLVRALKSHHITPEQINFLVCTHGHADHVGNLNLFLNADIFVGTCRSHKNVYYAHDFEKASFPIDKDIEVIATPGHTSTCISLIVKNTNLPNHAPVAVVGDLFEKEDDIFQEHHWIGAGSEYQKLQRENRLKVAEMVEYILPGHGPMFKVTEEMREKLREDVKNG